MCSSQTLPPAGKAFCLPSSSPPLAPVGFVAQEPLVLSPVTSQLTVKGSAVRHLGLKYAHLSSVLILLELFDSPSLHLLSCGMDFRQSLLGVEVDVEASGTSW